MSRIQNLKNRRNPYTSATEIYANGRLQSIEVTNECGRSINERPKFRFFVIARTRREHRERKQVVKIVLLYF